MLRKIQNSKTSAGTLVARRRIFATQPSDNVWCTISPNAQKFHPIWHGNKSAKMRYDCLPQRVQYDYCIQALQSCYVPFLSDDATLCGTWELNKNGNVHLHFLINDPALRRDQALQMFRRDVKCCPMTLQNMPSRKSSIDYMNNIVRLDPDKLDDVCDYMDKDFCDELEFPTFFIDPIDEGNVLDTVKPFSKIFGKKSKIVIVPDVPSDDEDSCISYCRANELREPQRSPSDFTC